MKIDAAFWQQLAADLQGGTFQPDGAAPPAFEHLTTDTRKLRKGAPAMGQTVFIALRGERHDGHDHVAKAEAMGVGGFILEDQWPGPNPDAAVMRVPSTLAALQAIGAEARRRRAGRVVGITGSNGKTTVKEWAHFLCGRDLRVSRSPGSWNSQIGVPLALWGMDDIADWHLVEAGISMPGEMSRLEDIIHPDLGVMVHMGDAHDSHFNDRAHKAREKAALFKRCDRIILGTDDPIMRDALESLGLKDRCLQWHIDRDGSPSTTERHVLRLTQERIGQGVGLRGTWRDLEVDWQLPFHDSANVSNALTAALLALEMGASTEGIGARLARLTPVGMRLEHLSGTGGGTVINDTWNHDLDGLTTALDALDRLPGDRKRSVIISDLIPFDPGDQSQCDRLRQTLENRLVNRWITVGPALSMGLPGVDPAVSEVLHFNDTEDLLDSTALDALEGWDVLVKGARPFAFERIARSLEANSHNTVLDLDLGRLAHNLGLHREVLQTPIMGMVKAFAYGAGDAVAVELDKLGVDRLAVAFVEEGIALRRAGVQCPILVLNADPQRFSDLLEWRLEPEVHALDMLDAWARARSASHRPADDLRGVHIKVETGMHRLGLGADEWERAGRMCAALDTPIISVYSHLSSSDDPATDGHTRAQIATYEKACAAVASGYSKGQGEGSAMPFLRHIANTAGAARFPEARFDLVRIGLGLYGIDPSDTLKGLQPIGRFHTRVAHIHEVPAGVAVGYGAADVADAPRTIATLPVGYADGLPRSAGMGNAKLHVAGSLRPTVGPVCMDSCMVDVTGCDVTVGSVVEIFGDHAPIEALATATGTIPYELLCRIPPRVRRRHLRT